MKRTRTYLSCAGCSQRCAVTDFSVVGESDPACDLIVAWNQLPASVRDTFRAIVRVDDATWAWGRGRAVTKGSWHSLTTSTRTPRSRTTRDT